MSELSDHESRVLARILVRAVREPPTGVHAWVLSAPPDETSAPNEARIERALVALGLVPPEALDEVEDGEAAAREELEPGQSD